MMPTPLPSRLSRLGDAVLARSPMQTWMGRARSGRLAVLAYHGVSDAQRFAAQLDWLVRHRHPVTLDEAADGLVGRTQLPAGAVLITFDDGQRNVVDVGLPLLQERGLPSAVFVVAGLLDTEEPYWWSEVEELSAAGAVGGPRGRDLVRELKAAPDQQRREVMADLRRRCGPPRPIPQLRRDELVHLESAGMAVGNHSMTHPCLPKCDTATIIEEIQSAGAELAAVLGHAPRVFAYPNGDWDDRSRRAVADAGHDVAFLFDHRVAVVPALDPLLVSRLRVNSTTTLDRFRTIVSGLHPALHRRRTGS